MHFATQNEVWQLHCAAMQCNRCGAHATLTTLLQIARTSELEESTRSLAAEFVVTLCEAREKASGMMRKLPQHLQDLFQCLVQFLLDVEVSLGASACGLYSELRAAEGTTTFMQPARRCCS